MSYTTNILLMNSAEILPGLEKETRNMTSQLTDLTIYIQFCKKFNFHTNSNMGNLERECHLLGCDAAVKASYPTILK
jgi:ligand-binding sensor protein